MDTTHGNPRLIGTYEVLLTALCQTDLASTLGWSMSVADPDAARTVIVTWALACGDPVVRSLAARLGQYVDPAAAEAPLSPLVCRSAQLGSALHITASSSRLLEHLDGKDVLIWDSGKGSRMGSLLQAEQPKGDILVTGSHKLHHFAAAAAQWPVNVLREANQDYVAFVASDQVVCLSESHKRELEALLNAAVSQDADVIFFDGPPALSLVRLRFMVSSAQPPHRNGVMALARDRLLLKNYGGAHIFQCVLLKRSLLPALASVLEAILEAARSGFDLDYGINEVAILPRLIRPNWLKRDRHAAARRIYAALSNLSAQTRRVRAVSMPLHVINVNMPYVLNHLKTRIRSYASEGVR